MTTDRIEENRRRVDEYANRYAPGAMASIHAELPNLGFVFVEQFGGIHPDYLVPEPKCPGTFRAYEGFCLLADGRAGFKDRWGGTWAAPEL